MSEDPHPLDGAPPSPRSFEGWGIGLALGIVIGVAIGTAMGNVGIGIALGVVFGLAFSGARTWNRVPTDPMTGAQPPSDPPPESSR